MTTTSKALTLALCLSSVMATGCLRSAVGLTASTKPLNPGEYTVLGEVEENDCRVKLFGIIPISGANSLQDATKDAISSRKGADALIQVSTEEFTDYWVVISRECVKVGGIAVKSDK